MRNLTLFATSIVLLFQYTSEVSAQTSWSITGNAGTNSAINYVGTSDFVPLVFKVGAQNSGIINSNGATAFGYLSSFNNTATNNSSFGSSSLYSNTTGAANSAFGYQSLYFNTTGTNNIGIGTLALYTNTTGGFNTATGNFALRNNTIGNNNSSFGRSALNVNTTGSNNTASGMNALKNNISGNDNVAMGYNSLLWLAGGSSNTAIGSNCFTTSIAVSNSTALGAQTDVTASNQIRLGNSTVSSIGGFANWTNVSDVRFKKDIKETVPGIEFIKKLRPVTYYLDMDKIALFMGTPDSLRLRDAERLKGGELQTGFIAQEVEKSALELGFNFSGVDKPKNQNDYYGLRYSEFVVPLVKAVQEQQTMIEQKDKKIEELEKRLDRQATEMNEIKNTIRDIASSMDECCKISQQSVLIDVKNETPYLEQNTPNPFSETTIIKYFIPANCGSSIVSIKDINGTELSRFTILEKGKGQIVLTAGTLKSGTYIYDLIIEGKVIDSKKMVIVK